MQSKSSQLQSLGMHPQVNVSRQPGKDEHETFAILQFGFSWRRGMDAHDGYAGSGSTRRIETRPGEPPESLPIAIAARHMLEWSRNALDGFGADVGQVAESEPSLGP